MSFLRGLARLHEQVFSIIERALKDWFPGLFARIVFLAVLYPYFLHSAMTKVGPGIVGFFMLEPGAYYQIALPAVEAAGGDIAAVPFFPWGAIVTLGTYMEFVLPFFIVVGLLTRIASFGMIAFIIVQSLVDINILGIDRATIGMLFDRFPDGSIADQRLLWIFPLASLVIFGPGRISLDAILPRLAEKAEKPAIPTG